MSSRLGKTSKRATPSTEVASEPPASLAPLLAAAASKDGAATLTAALAAWRVQRAPALADLIDAISKQVSGAPVSSELEFTKVAAAKNPLDLGRLLPAVAELPVNFLPTAAELLAAFPDDPRISSTFATWTMVPITTSMSKQAFWSTMFATVQRNGDTRVVKALNERLADKPWDQAWWNTYFKRLRRTVAKLEALVPVPPIKIPKLMIAELSPVAAATPVVVAQSSPKLSSPLLAQASVHLAAGRTVAAIEAIVTHWRTSRIPALADLVDRATRLLPTFDLPLPPITKGSPDPWLVALEADPGLHLPQLLLHLGLGGAKRAQLQMAHLATLPDDPRISYRLAELGDTRVNGKEAQYWKALFQTLARHLDVRTCEPVRRKFDDFQNTYYYEVRHAKRFMGAFALAPESAFQTWPLQLPDADQKLFDKLAAQVDVAVDKAESRERAMIAAIGEEWTSDAPRQVYADWLMEREHPRGELLMLACKTARTSAENTQLQRLRAQSTTFGALGELVDDTSELDRGLYREIKLASSTTTLCWRSAARSPLAPLVESVAFATEDLPTPEDFARFVAAATRLRRLDECGREVLARLDPGGEKHWKVVESTRGSYAIRREPRVA